MIYDVKVSDASGNEFTEIPKTINWLKDLAQSGNILQSGCHSFEIIEEDWMSKEIEYNDFCEIHELERAGAMLNVTDAVLSYESGRTVINYNTEEADYEEEVE